MSHLSIEQLEQVYDTLATAIDSTLDQERSELFLTKLCLLCAEHLGDAALFDQLEKTALQDLQP